jgi:S1-C subfamily serine protease
MPQDRKTIAEARALQACIQVTTDPVEQNRLWNRYYALSDEVFPEAAVLHKRYKTLEGAERHRFKTEYMELVRRLWAATDPQAAYPISFSETPAIAPTPRFKTPVRQQAPLPSRRPAAAPKIAFAVLATLVMVAGAFALWQYGQSRQAASGVPIATASPVAPVSVPEAQPANAVVPETPAAAAASAEPVSQLGPAPEFNPPLEKIEADLAQNIVPAFATVPDELRGKGDRLVHPDGEYSDVYVIESNSLFYVRIPERGVVESLSKAGAEVTISTDAAIREALLAIWNQNREELDRVASEREKEKANRLASYRKAFDQQVADHDKASAEARWRARAADWLALGAEQRNVLRARAYSNWEAIQQEVATMQELYFKISRAYEMVGITDSRLGSLASAYNSASRTRGRDYEMEDAFVQYNWEREDLMREVVEWEKEYYRLNEYLTKNYPDIEKRVEEIKRLDDSLPAEVRVAEATVNWDAALDPESPSEEAGGFGTGFVVARGIVMTCAHVVRGATKVTVLSGGGARHDAKIHTLDMGNDWALLEVNGLESEPIPVSVEKPNVGATIYCIGYPLGGIKDSTDPIVGSGNIAALQRLDGDERFMQITAPVNPGNSGGPVLDQYGRWVGIVSQKLNDMETLKAAETVTQGVNFAVKASFIQPLVQPKGGVQLTPAPAATGQPLTLEAMTQRYAPSIVKIVVE